MLDFILGLFSNDMGIDLGTANTVVYVRGKGIVLSEPSVVAVRKGTHDIVAVGNEAKEMLGRTPHGIEAIRPLRDGVIADFEVTEGMLRYFIKKAHGDSSLFQPRPRVVVAVPSKITEVEKRAVEDSAHQAGAREVHLIPEPMAAAVGIDLPVEEPSGNMIVDIGGGTTEVAIISLAGLVTCDSLRVAGDELTGAITLYLKRTYNMMIGERMAESIKIQIGSAYSLEEELTMEVKGRDLVAGLPKTLTINSEEIREALAETVTSIVESIRLNLENCPPEIASDLVDKGMWLAGGGALLRGLDVLLNEETGLPVHVAKDPLMAIAMGTGKALDNIDILKKMSSPSTRE